MASELYNNFSGGDIRKIAVIVLVSQCLVLLRQVNIENVSLVMGTVKVIKSSKSTVFK